MNPNVKESIAQSPKPIASRYISEGFDLFGKKPGMAIVMILVQVAISIVASMVPFAGNIVNNLVLAPLFMLGFYIAFDNFRYGTPNFNDIFAGFRDNALGAIGVNIVTVLLSIPGVALLTYGYGEIIGWENLEAASAGNQDAIDPSLMDITSGIGWLSILAGLVLMVLLMAPALFSLPMLRFKGLAPMDAVKASFSLVGKHYLSVVGFIILLGLVNFAGALMLGVGLLVTIPASYAAVYAAFDHLVGARGENEGDQIINHFIS